MTKGYMKLMGFFVVSASAIVFFASPERAQMKATATAHSVSLTWTDPTGQPSGSAINLYRGSAAGGESTTPVNGTPVAIGVKAFTDTSVTANSTYFYVAKTCVGTVCSAPSNEVSVTVPLVAGDLTPPSGLSSSAQ